MSHFKKLIITEHCSIVDAIKVIDEQGQRIAMVVDKDEKLIGTITDGDIRRALLKQMPLTSFVSEIMSCKPIVAVGAMSKQKLKAIFDQHQILHIPITDEQGLIIGLETLQEPVQTTQRKDNPVFLMAGGFGTRLKPLTDNCPKPMLKVGGKPILEIILANFISEGFHNFYISTHYMPEVIRDYFGAGEKWDVSITYIHEDEPLGTGGALGLLPKHDINLPLILTNGDLLTNINFSSLLEFHLENKGIATIGVREFEHQVPFGVITAEGNKILTMVEKPKYKYFVNAGVYVLSPEIISAAISSQRIDMPTLLGNRIKGDKETVTMFPIHEYWLDIGRMDDFNQAQKDVGTFLNE